MIHSFGYEHLLKAGAYDDGPALVNPGTLIGRLNARFSTERDRIEGSPLRGVAEDGAKG